MGALDALHAGHASLAIHREMGVRREEYLDAMTFQSNARPLFTEIFGPLIGLKEEWQAQGATPEELSLAAFRYRQPLFASVGVNTGMRGGYEERILEENDDYILALDRLGRRVKLFRRVATLALPLDYPVRDFDDWLRIKPWFAFDEDRLPEGWAERARAEQAAGKVLCVGIPGGFDLPRQLMGEEELCASYYTQPELVRDILNTVGDMAVRVLERVTAAVTVDQLNVHDDMAGKSGPLAGPRQIREFIAPYYRRVWDLLSARGARTFYQDSDGDMSPIVEDLLESGINVMGPAEPVGGNDIVALRERYGKRLAFHGGIDKHVLRTSRDDIVRELEYRVPPLVRTGGCLLGIDHRIPNGTPLANYRFYIETMWTILEREMKGA